MSEINPKIRVEELTKLLNEHNHRYYVLNEPEISDFDFDALLRELENLEKSHPELADKNSPTQRVGGDITKNFESVAHDYPMLSLNNTYSNEELHDFAERTIKTLEREPEYICELKYDGVAIAIVYENGRLVRAVTRGDGSVGEDVTANVRTIRTIPLELTGDYPEKFEIRGEIVFPHEAFNALNASREKLGEPKFANPRNTASGTIKMQDSSIVAGRGLDCFLYSVLGVDFESHYEGIQAARRWGFKVPSEELRYITRVNSIDGVEKFIQYWNKEREQLPFETDGIVVKVNGTANQKLLGSTSKFPRWAVAYKFKAERVATVLERVTYQVGRTGAITPVANLVPVQLGGTMVKRASLHNSDQIDKLDVREGDTVFVEKGGEIIPKIVGVDKSSRSEDTKKLVYADRCPECGETLVRKEGEAQHYCLNESGCPPQIKGKIQHFIGRKMMNIDGLGAETVEQLFEAKLLNNIADLYDLKAEYLLPLERMAEKSVNNILAGIEASKTVPFPQVLYAIGIRYVGETVAKKLAQHFGSVKNLLEADLETLVNVDEIGQKIAESVKDYFEIPENIDLINRLIKAGLKLELNKEELENRSNKLEGLTFVVSGVFSSMSRDEIKNAVETNGGKVTSSISKKTSYLIRGENMGPSKLEKAEKLEIALISEEEFVAMLE